MKLLTRYTLTIGVLEAIGRRLHFHYHGNIAFQMMASLIMHWIPTKTAPTSMRFAPGRLSCNAAKAKRPNMMPPMATKTKMPIGSTGLHEYLLLTWKMVASSQNMDGTKKINIDKRSLKPPWSSDAPQGHLNFFISSSWMVNRAVHQNKTNPMMAKSINGTTNFQPFSRKPPQKAIGSSARTNPMTYEMRTSEPRTIRVKRRAIRDTSIMKEI